MTTQKSKNSNLTQYNFTASKQLQYFNQYRLIVQNNQNECLLLNLINIPSKQQQQQSQQQQQQTSSTSDQYAIKKLNSLISGCILRCKKSLYHGNKQYYQDLQYIIDTFQQNKILPQPTIKQTFLYHSLPININKNKLSMLIQCQKCAQYTILHKFCYICQDIHYCHQGCQMKQKYTHQREKCRIRSFPRISKKLQVEIHVGTDIGKSVWVCYQHQVSLGLNVRGEKFVNNVWQYFINGNGKVLAEQYEVKLENKIIKFQQQTKNYNKQNQQSSLNNLKIDSIQNICQIYRNNKILKHLQLFMLENGAILTKIIREIHDNHVKEVFIYNYL